MDFIYIPAMTKLPPMSELQAFAAAVRHLSFRKAAAELGVTPTAISHQIRLLEGHCGHALFRRRPRPLALTDAGAKLARYVGDGLDTLKAGMDAVRRVEDKQFLRVTTTNAFASRWLVPRLPRWSKAHPETPLEVIGTDGVVDLQAGDADVAIRYATGRKPPAKGKYEELVTDCFWPVCSPKLLASGKPLARLSELKGQVLIHAYWAPADLDPPTWQTWLTLARSREPDVPEFGEMEHLSFREELHAIEAVINGQGFGMLSSVLVGAELAEGALVKAFDLSLPGYGFYVLRRASHPRETTIRKFSAWLQSVA
jgi:LysR family transcriptional regulator, glycine cleavage system transcriptional activator